MSTSSTNDTMKWKHEWHSLLFVLFCSSFCLFPYESHFSKLFSLLISTCVVILWFLNIF
jgi:hypothetical protein